MSPALLSTVRCCEIAGWVTAKREATSPALRSPSASRRRICLRFGWAIASKTSIGLSNLALTYLSVKYRMLPGRLSERLVSLAGQAGDHLRRRLFPGELVRLTRPQVHLAPLACGARRSPNRSRDVMDLRVSGRRMTLVLAHEPVHDPARGLARERSRHRGRGAARDGLPVDFGCARLRTQQERRADLTGTCASGEDRGQTAARCDAARGDQRKLEPRPDQLDQGDQPVGRLIVVSSRAAVAARLVALHHEAVRARLRRL